MRYIDSGTRDAVHAVASWLQAELGAPVAELRIQSGFFSRNALRPFLPRFAALQEANSLIRVVVGSNDGETLAAHVAELVQALGLPRPRSDLGVVYLSGAFYHPKTFHMRRSDGSQTAYVGSANFTLPGIAAKHVEAGILLDTRDGDPEQLLAEIAQATDAWFDGERPGIEIVGAAHDVERLLLEGILSAVPAPRAPRTRGAGGQPPARPALSYLVQLIQPQQATAVAAPAAGEPIKQDGEQPDDDLELAIAQRTPPYPPYMYFEPHADAPTSGAAALSGFGLGDAAGLIVRLSRDNDRHWRQAPGTANLSIPTAAASSIRFGIYGNRARPRAEFDLHLRYVDDAVVFTALPETTGLMSFGYTDGDTGHGDLRLVIPRAPVAQIRAYLQQIGRRLPRAGDLAILEWPTPAQPTFRMTVTQPDSGLGQAISSVWEADAIAGRLASRGACWLPGGLTPDW